MVTKVVLDPHAGEIAVGRLFSGSIKKGDQMYVAGMPNANRVQSVGMFVGGDRIATETVTAGNIIAVSGLRDAQSGSTISSNKEMTPFERIVHNSGKRWNYTINVWTKIKLYIGSLFVKSYIRNEVILPFSTINSVGHIIQ